MWTIHNYCTVARLRAMMLVYVVFFSILVIHVGASLTHGLIFPQKQASTKEKTRVPRKHRREISDPTLEKTLQPHLRFPASGSAMGDAGLGCEPLHAAVGGYGK